MTRLIEQMRKIKKISFTLADLEKLSDFSRETLYVVLNRLVKSGQLIRLRPGLYILPEQFINLDVVANAYYMPSYLSFESALSRYGILSQIPATLTFATSRKSKRVILGSTEAEYRQLKPSLFFGYITTKGLIIAEPEKALLDTLYMMAKGKLSMNIQGLRLGSVPRKKLATYMKRYPAGSVRKMKEWLEGAMSLDAS